MVFSMYVLDIPENLGIVEVSNEDSSLRVDRVGPYFRISIGSREYNPEICIDRRESGCRHAVWYSCVAGLANAQIIQHDKDALRVVAR